MLETPLLDLPTGVCTFFMDDTMPRTPAVAVASGSYLYIYKNLRPYFKFTLPTLEVNATEADLWTQVREDKIDVTAMRQMLETLRDEVGEATLTVRSLKLLQMTSDEMQSFVPLFQNTPLKRQTVITSLATLAKNSAEGRSISCLIVGTEHGDLYILDPEAFTVLIKLSLPAVPVFISAVGVYEVDYRIIVACRDACVYTFRKGAMEPKNCVRLASQPCGLQKVGKTSVVATMDNKLSCFTSKGKSLWTISLPAAITALEVMDHKARGFKAVLVALKNCEVRVYKDKYLVNTLKSDDIVVGLKFGRFSREESGLVMVAQNGSLSVKLLKRTVNFEGRELSSGPPPAQSTKLNVPKKTKIFVEQTQRERENPTAMHTAFQHDLYRLKLETARSYVNSLSKRMLPLSSTAMGSLKITAQVQGLGPLFKLTVTVHNTSPSEPANNLMLVFRWEEGLYSVQKPILKLPLLVPLMSYDFENMIECLDTNGRTAPIKVIVHKEGTLVPFLTASVDMPVSESLVIA
jgi:Bardet-Biedl syndrome 1 protein